MPMAPETGPLDILTTGEMVVDFISVEKTETPSNASTFRRIWEGRQPTSRSASSKLGGTSAVIVKTVIGAFGQFLAEVMPYVTIVKPSLEDARSLFYAGLRSAGQSTQ